jgi:hypothetical protein
MLRYLFPLLLIVACADKKKESSANKVKPLYIVTCTVSHQDSTVVETTDTTLVTSEYFEVGLYSISQSFAFEQLFKARKNLDKRTSTTGTLTALKDFMSSENFEYQFFTIEEKGVSSLTFDSSTDFLNFMSERGYEMVDQTKHGRNFNTDYTFKKKP